MRIALTLSIQFLIGSVCWGDMLRPLSPLDHLTSVSLSFVIGTGLDLGDSSPEAGIFYRQPEQSRRFQSTVRGQVEPLLRSSGIEPELESDSLISVGVFGHRESMGGVDCYVYLVQVDAFNSEVDPEESGVVGRFQSVDPVLGRAVEPQSWNRYAYVMNSPMGYTDPTGEATAAQFADDAQGFLFDFANDLTGSTGYGVTGFVADFSIGVTRDIATGLLDVLKLGDGVGTVLGGGATGWEAAGAVGQDGLRALGLGGGLATLGKTALRKTATSTAEGLAARAASGPANPLAGTRYTGKVRQQMRPHQRTGVPDNHGFPLEVDNFAGQGTTRLITGRDGVARTKVELPGSYRGQGGTFEWIVESSGTVNHRLFVPLPPG